MDIDNQTISTTLPIELDSRWVHMDTIEHEKLEWIKDLPKPSAQRTVNDSVRKILFVCSYQYKEMTNLSCIFSKC
jgi:hypothetical protein